MSTISYGGSSQEISGLNLLQRKQSNNDRSATLCVLTYNQERFVAYSIAGALAQDHENLEIIISDDCSTDGTWNIIQNALANYKGPHRVIIRKSSTNRGTLQHLLDVAALASGVLIVINAGDDISTPNRCKLLCQAWQESPFAAAFSDYAMINDDNVVTQSHYRYDDSLFTPRDYVDGVNTLAIHGASSVYETRILRDIVRSTGDCRVLYEDTWLSLVIAVLGLKVVHLPEVLVLYRQHNEAVTNFRQVGPADTISIRDSDNRWQNRSAAYAATLIEFRKWYGNRKNPKYSITSRLARDLKCFCQFGRWSELTLFERIATLVRVSRAWMLRAALLRMLPMEVRLILRR